jgi:hypothetical protein
VDTDMIFEGRRSGEELVGQTSGPDGTVWTWRAERTPSLARARAPHWGEPIRLFDGKDISGWIAGNTAAQAWRIADGTLVSPGNGADLRSTAAAISLLSSQHRAHRASWQTYDITLVGRLGTVALN